MDVWDYVPFGVLSALLAAIVVFIYHPYLFRFISYLKMREHELLNHRTLDLVHLYLRIISVGLLVLAIVVVGEWLAVPGLEDVFGFVRDYAFVFNAFVVFFLFVVLSKLGSDAAAMSRRKAEKDSSAVFKPGIMEFNELFIKYGMYVLGLIMAVAVGIISIHDVAVRNDIIESLNLDNVDTGAIWSDLFSLFVVLVILYIIGKFVSIILEDFKHRSKKFQPGLIDIIKAAVRYSLYWVAFVVSLTVVLEMLSFEHLEIVMWFVVALTLAIVVIIGLSPATRNAICGIVLLTTDSVNKGDWVRIGNGTPGEVVSQGLTITRLKTRTGDIIDLPNEMVLGSTVHNYTKLGGTRMRLTLALETAKEPDYVEKLLLDISSGLGGPGGNAPRLLTTSVNENVTEYTVDLWTREPSSTEEMASEFLKRFKERADAEGIAIISTGVKA